MVPDVTSVTVTNSPGLVSRRIIGSIRRWMTSLAMTRNFSGSSQVTVTSATIPPASLSHWVYTIRPIPAVTSLADSRLSTAAASGPCTISLAISVMSSTPTASRTAPCSRATMSCDACRPKSSVVCGCSPGSANHSGNSQPADWPKCAPCAASRSWSTERRMLRAVDGFQVGHTASPNRTPSCSTVRSRRNRRDVS